MKINITLAIVLLISLTINIYLFNFKKNFEESYVYYNLFSYVQAKQANSIIKIFEDPRFKIKKENILNSKYYDDVWCTFDKDSILLFYGDWYFKFDSNDNLKEIKKDVFKSNDFKEVNLNEAGELLKKGEINDVFQAHDQTVTMKDKNNTIYLLFEKKIDDIIHLARKYKHLNKKMIIGTE